MLGGPCQLPGAQVATKNFLHLGYRLGRGKGHVDLALDHHGLDGSVSDEGLREGNNDFEGSARGRRLGLSDAHHPVASCLQHELSVKGGLRPIALEEATQEEGALVLSVVPQRLDQGNQVPVSELAKAVLVEQELMAVLRGLVAGGVFGGGGSGGQ